MLRRTLAAATAAAFVAVPAAAQAAPGDVDTSFAAPFGFVNDGAGNLATGVVALPGGGTVVLSRDGHLIAYTAAGQRDSAFGADGVAKLIDGELGATTALARDADGRLLVGGRDDGTAVVIRLTATGAIDPTFGAGGRTVIRYGTFQDHYVLDLDVQADGRILVGGYGAASGRDTAAVARLTAAGALDTSFAGDGTATIPGVDRDTQFDALAADGAGGVYAVGASRAEGLAVHLLSDGTRDSAFGTDGERRVHIGAEWDRTELTGVATAAGRVYASASLVPDAGTRRGVVVALDAATGADDGAFGVASLAGAVDAEDLVLGSGRGLLVSGSIVEEGALWQRSYVARVDAQTGALDPAFAGDGLRSLPYDTAQWGRRLARDAAGRVTIGGEAANQLLAWRVIDVDGVVTSSGGGTPSGGGVVVMPPPGGDPVPPAPPAEQAPSQDPPAPSGSAAAYRPAAWFHRVRSATLLRGEADQGAARVQVAITQRDGRRCRAVTSTRRARLGSSGTCSPTRARWLAAQATPRAGQTQLWSLRLARRLPAGRYVATVRALDQEGLAGQTGQVSFRVR